MYTLICNKCNKQFQSRFKHTKVCSDCRNARCEICGKLFTRDWPYDQKYCSPSCRNEARKDPQRNEAITNKRKNTVQAKYGVDNVSQLKEISDKIAANHRSAEYKQKLKETSIERYGVPFYQSADINRQKYREGHTSSCQSKYSVAIDVSNSDFDLEFLTSRIVTAMKEQNIQFTKDTDDTSSQFTIESAKTTLCIPDAKYIVDSQAGLNKIADVSRQGRRCIHVFPWDSVDKIMNLLSNKDTIYARLCDLKPIDSSMYSPFMDTYHLQNNVRGTKCAYGLFYKDELVQAMTFGDPRYNKNYQWELLRLCTHYKYRIVGGPSKIFSAFMKEHQPESIISYCDRSKFTGQVYTNLGFTLDHVSDPNRIWTRSNDYITDNLLRQRGYDQLFNTEYGKGTSNEELMLQNGWIPIYDCGQFVFTLTQS